jgi:hypothetical protein
MRNTTITVDASQLDAAATALLGVYRSLDSAARGLTCVDVSVEMPAGLAGRVIGEVSSVSSAVARAAVSLEPLPGELRRRAAFARVADDIATGQLGKLPLSLPADLVGRFRDIELDAIENGRLPPRAQAVGAAAGDAAEKWAKGVEVVGHVAFGAELAARTLADLRNPYLDTEHRIAGGLARVGAYVGTEKAAEGVEQGVKAIGSRVAVRSAERAALALGERAGLTVAERAAVAATGGAIAGPPGVAAAVALSVGWFVFDSKLHATDWVADRFVDGADAVGRAARAAGEGIGDGVRAGLDKAKDVIGGLF